MGLVNVVLLVIGSRRGKPQSSVSLRLALRMKFWQFFAADFRCEAVLRRERRNVFLSRTGSEFRQIVLNERIHITSHIAVR